jgi:hypothetical protein
MHYKNVESKGVNVAPRASIYQTRRAYIQQFEEHDGKLSDAQCSIARNSTSNYDVALDAEFCLTPTGAHNKGQPVPMELSLANNRYSRPNTLRRRFRQDLRHERMRELLIGLKRDSTNRVLVPSSY